MDPLLPHVLRGKGKPVQGPSDSTEALCTDKHTSEASTVMRGTELASLAFGRVVGGSVGAFLPQPSV